MASSGTGESNSTRPRGMGEESLFGAVSAVVVSLVGEAGKASGVSSETPGTSGFGAGSDIFGTDDGESTMSGIGTSEARWGTVEGWAAGIVV